MGTVQSDGDFVTLVLNRDELLAAHTALNEVCNAIGLQHLKDPDEHVLAHGAQLLSALDRALKYLDTDADDAPEPREADVLLNFRRFSSRPELRVQAEVSSIRAIVAALAAVDRELEDWEFGIRTGAERHEFRQLQDALNRVLEAQRSRE